MDWLREILIAIVITGVITTWLTGFLNQLVPSPARTRLALKNCWGNRLQRAEDGFRVVLCWLGKDISGRDTETVAQAFVGIDGISLVRSARIVSATGAADEWRPAMKDSARAILDKWNADLAIVGLVKQSDAVLSLWFVPRSSDDTLHRGDQPYTLENVTLGADFHHDLRAQLTAMALTSLAPLADGLVRGQVIDKGLHDATEKLISLVEGRTIAAGGRKAALQLVLGIALCALGERERSTRRLDQSVDALRAALREFTRHRAPVLWATTLNNLAMALRALGAIRQRRPKIYSRELAELIFVNPYCRIGDVVKADIAKRQTAAVYLKALAAEGILEEIKAGRENLYINPPLLTLLTAHK